MEKTIIIGIAGGTASGKTTLAKLIKEEYKDDVTIFSHDFYYKSHNHMTMEERLKTNYDCPEAFETELLIEHLNKLIKNETIQRPIYNYGTRLREQEMLEVKPTKIIVIEGILALENKELLNLMDIKVFVDAEPDVRLIRLIKRDIKERELNVEYIIGKYMSTLKPMHDKYIQPSKNNADIIISEDDEKGMQELKEKINKLMN